RPGRRPTPPCPPPGRAVGRRRFRPRRRGRRGGRAPNDWSSSSASRPLPILDLGLRGGRGGGGLGGLRGSRGFARRGRGGQGTAARPVVNAAEEIGRASCRERV